MQENAPQWDPITIDHHASWELRLLVFYLLFACVFLFVRVVQIAWFLWRSRRVTLSSSANCAESPEMRKRFLSDLTLASIRIASLRRGAVLTFLFSLLTLTTTTTRMLHSVIERYFGPAAVAGSMFDGFAVFAVGLAVCISLYVAFAVLEGMLSRRKLRCNEESITNR